MNAAVQKLEMVFSEIARTRMADVPILNRALRVEAVGFREWEGRWIGVLITPWMINLVLLPGKNAPLVALALDQKTVWHFPSGGYEFMGLNEPQLGTCHLCSLISPVTEFASHVEAHAIAEEMIRILFDQTQTDSENKIEDARLKGESVSQQNMSRRDFLRMPLMGG
jgi:[NiFe] hydrogenase assembly HybE family chaperone